jgi:hypothetical protein
MLRLEQRKVVIGTVNRLDGTQSQTTGEVMVYRVSSIEDVREVAL